MDGHVVYDPFAVLDDPYPTYARLREEDPVHYSPVIRSWVLSRHADVLDFFRDDVRLSSDRTAAKKYRGLRPTPVATFQSDAPHHTRIRAAAARALAPAVAARAEELVRQVCDELLAPLGGGGRFDLVECFARRLPLTVISEIVGVEPGHRDRFARWALEFAVATDHHYARRQAEGGATEVWEYLADLVARRRSAAADHLCTALMESCEGGEALSETEVVAVLVALLFAGFETTVNLIGNGLLALLRHPRQLERLQSEDVARTATEELLRFDSPAQLISRTAATSFELRGRTIERGDTVVGLIGAANRDPEVFPRADVLDLTRHPNPHLAFGFGTHYCLGAQLSRLEGRIALPALVRRLPRLELVRAERRQTAVLRGLASLVVEAS